MQFWVETFQTTLVAVVLAVVAFAGVKFGKFLRIRKDAKAEAAETEQ